ncbi:ATP-binding SpoIIE family protein phosphatase [Streptomyces sp. SP17KL33]|uniref:ATP-binding SpoIIE family protein phosphatase n=1 Tax=Streptomyces sp. SP17KL33 TaxID=3002534 RepID=UPI002E7A7B37|nr:SpoIIE family protein phosphatase [Streptomyces sp. SP17KL33]MEE1830262.1 SpoIIE family protein phosphatase [Streptomyces sp. SP17KL33]
MSHSALKSSFGLDGIATAVLDGQGTVVGWSAEAAELVGRTAVEVCGKPVGDLLVGPSEQCCGAEVGELRGPTSGLTSVRHRSGRAIEVAFRVLRLEGGSHFFVLAAPLSVATDLEQGASVLQALLSQERIGVGIHDRDLRVVRTNMGPALPVGGCLADLMAPEDAEDAKAALGEVLSTGVPLVGYERRIRASQAPGLQEYCYLAAVRLEDTAGRPAGVATFVTDATERWRARRDLELRHQASVLIGASLDVKRTAQDLVDVLVPVLGDVAWVELAEAVFDGDEPPRIVGGGQLHLRRAAVATAAGPWPAALLQPGEVVPWFPDLPVMRALQQGAVFTMSDRTKVARLGDPELSRLFVPEGAHSFVAAPLYARGLMLGSVTLWRTGQSRPFDQQEAELLAEITSRAALSVDNARRYTREHRAAVTLQQRLLPRATTDSPAAETAGLYAPAAGGAEIGGDWFDVIPLPSLRVAFVVGDVVGHGLGATATMGRLRTAVQTLADLELGPDELLTHLDDLVIRLAAEADLARQDAVGATCIYAVLDPVTGRCTMATAGHPPPFVIRPDSTVRTVELSPGPPLGVGGMPFETTTVDLEPGSILALYTDGLIHRFHPDPYIGLRHLADRLATASSRDASLIGIGRSVLADAADPPPRDDIALLLARVRALAEGTTVYWEFPADPAVVGQARAVVSRQLAEWGLGEAAFVTELVVSELVTNAIRYAGGPIGLRLIHNESLVCEVTDPSNTQPRLRRARTTDEGGRGLFLVAQLTRRWGSRYGLSGKTVWAEQPVSAARLSSTVLT